MNEKRKLQIDSLWIDSDVGKWAHALAEGRDSDAEEILNKLFEFNPSPYQYLMHEEEKLCNKIKRELISDTEGRMYIKKIEEDTPELLEIMIAHEFSMIDMYYC